MVVNNTINNTHGPIRQKNTPSFTVSGIRGALIIILPEGRSKYGCSFTLHGKPRSDYGSTNSPRARGANGGVMPSAK